MKLKEQQRDTPGFVEGVEKLHTAFALPLVTKYGTSDEGERMLQIARKHNQEGAITKHEQEYRNELVKKYLPMSCATEVTWHEPYQQDI